MYTTNPQEHRKSKKKQKQEQQVEVVAPVIPGLSEDVAAACMARVPRVHYQNMQAVSRRWRDVLCNSASAVYRHRRHLGLQEGSLLQFHITCRSSSSSLMMSCGTHTHDAISVTTTELHLFSSSSTNKYHIEQQQKKKKEDDVLFCFDAEALDPFWTGFMATAVNVYVVLVVRFLDPKMRISGSPGIGPPCPWIEHIYAVDVCRKQIHRLPCLSIHRDHATYAILDGILYAVGGLIADGSRRVPCASVYASTVVERYDFESKSWSRVAIMPLGMSVNQCTAVSGRLLIMGTKFDMFWDVAIALRKQRTAHPTLCVSYCPISDSWYFHGSHCLDSAFTSTCVFSDPQFSTVVAVHTTLAGPPNGTGNRLFRLVNFPYASATCSKMLDLQTCEVSFCDHHLSFSTWQTVCRLCSSASLDLHYRENKILRLHNLSDGSGNRCVVSLATFDPDDKLTMLNHVSLDFTVYLKTFLWKPSVRNQLVDSKLCPVALYF